MISKIDVYLYLSRKGLDSRWLVSKRKKNAKQFQPRSLEDGTVKLGQIRQISFRIFLHETEFLAAFTVVT